MDQKLLCNIIKIFFQHQLEIKMYHFQTKLYGAHKASDMYHGGFLEKMDKFLEAAQGIAGQTKLQTVDLKFKTLDDMIINKDLLAIRDEMIADANQFKYLLLFK